MAYCRKCGTKNADTAEYCVRCGSKLGASQEKSWDKKVEKWGEDLGKRAEEWGEQIGKHAEEWGEDFGRRAEKECFGLPHGGFIFCLLIGVIIILVGVTSLLTGYEIVRHFWPLFWPLLLIVFGFLIAVGALYTLSRRR